MYVLMDMEWYQCGDEQIPTQLAAIRVDDNLECVSEFYTRFNPGEGKIVWLNIAFSGGRKIDFRNAAALPYLLRKFALLLKHDDTLLWWHESGAALFRSLFKLEGIPLPRMGVMHRLVRKLIGKERARYGGPYNIARAMSLTVPTPEHYSPNDVNVLRSLLISGGIKPSTLIANGCCDWKALTKPETVKIQESAKRSESVKKTVSNDFRFFHDIDTGKFHRKSCPKCPTDKAKLQGFQTLKGCLRRKLEPCECCAAEAENFIEKNREKNREIVLHLKYSVNSKQKLAHFPGCAILGRIKPANIKEFNSITEAKNQGYNLCPHCNPMTILYNKEKENIERYCKESKLNFTMKDNVAYVTSVHDFWRIMIGDTTGTLTLYHRNMLLWKVKKHGSGVPMYHKQKSQSTTIIGHLRYITNHDNYRDKLLTEEQRPKKKNPSDRLPSPYSKRGKKLVKQQKKQKKRNSVSRVLALIEELEAASR